MAHSLRTIANVKRTEAQSGASRVAPKNATGRPRKARLVESRLDEVLTLAADVFIERGFDKANYNEICKRASISKATLYERYPTKEELFLGVLDHRMQALVQLMSMQEIDPDASVAEALTAFGNGLLNSVLSDAQVELIRTISTVVHRLPILGRQFYAMGPALGMRSLTLYLAAQVRSGKLVSEDDPEIMTRVFINLAIDGILYRKLLGVAGKRSSKAQKEQVARAVHLFLRLYGNHH